MKPNRIMTIMLPELVCALLNRFDLEDLHFCYDERTVWVTANSQESPPPGLE